MAVVDIEKFYKRNSLDMFMFGYVSGLLFNIDTTQEKAMLNFLKFNSLDNDRNIETLIIAYRRMMQEYIDLQKTA